MVITIFFAAIIYLTNADGATQGRPINRGRFPLKTDSVAKNDRINVKIVQQSQERGEGIAKIFDKVTQRPCDLLIPNTIVGDEVEVLILRIQNSIAYGKLLKVLVASRNRINSSCAVADRCGGCQLLFQTYKSQLDLKQQAVKLAFTSHSSIKKVSIDTVVPAITASNYRNKAQFSIQRSDKGSIDIGLYAPNSQKAVDTKYCYIQHQLVNDVLKSLRVYFAKNPFVSIFDQTKKTGSLCHIVIRVGFNTEAVMVCLVSNTKYKDIKQLSSPPTTPSPSSTTSKIDMDQLNSIVKAISATPGVKCVLYNFNPHPMDGNILGEERNEKSKLLFGDCDFIHEVVAGIRVRVSLQSFMQSNPLQAEVLYRKVVELANFVGSEVVWDMFCGVGTISLFVAPFVRQVIGVEDCKPAVEDAEVNKELNNIQNVRFICAKAEEVLSTSENVNRTVLSGLLDGDCYAPDDVVAILNPPRKGCEESLLVALAERKVRKVVYVSCNPKSLARDLDVLVGKMGYTLDKVSPVDMFPHTTHVEVVCLLTLQVAQHEIDRE